MKPRLRGKHKDIIKHSLGLNYKNTPFRNHFVAGGPDERPDLKSLVEMGYMTVHENKAMCTGYIYYVTEAGAQAVGSSLPKEQIWEKQNLNKRFCTNTHIFKSAES